MDRNLYKISAKGTSCEGQDVLCFKTKDRKFYSPEHKKLFTRHGGTYTEEDCVWPVYDREWELTTPFRDVTIILAIVVDKPPKEEL